MELQGVPTGAETTRTAVIWLDGVIRAVFLPQAEVGLEDAMANVALTANLVGGRRRPALIDLRQVRSQTADARAFLAGPEANRVSCAVALLIGSPVSRMVGNFFLGVNRPTVPTRLFTDATEALSWLEQFQPAPGDAGG